MGYKAIIVHVENTKECEARVMCAADLADRFDALLIGCGSEMIPPQGYDPAASTDGELLMRMAETVDQHLAEARDKFERLIGARKHRWISERAMPDETINMAARAADLIVTSRAPRGSEDAIRNEDPGLLVVVSGRPVLTVPPGKDYLPGERVLVCWKDTRESRRAVADAMPFLKRAEEVLVAEVASPKDLGAACKRADEVADFLRRHGVRATGEGVIKDERRTATILLDRASCFGADLIVSGGYGRSRLGEWAFGGVTKALLNQSEKFVLLSH